LGCAALDPGFDVFGLRDVDDGAVGAVGAVGCGEVGLRAAAVVDCCAFGEEGLDDCFADGFGAAWEGWLAGSCFRDWADFLVDSFTSH
jgi:hypothetical protein